MRTLVDTDIWSEIFKGKNATVLARAGAYLSQHGRYTLTAVTVFEVIQGLQHVQRASRIDAFSEMLEAQSTTPSSRSMSARPNGRDHGVRVERDGSSTFAASTR
ncbi:hypothetical protein WME95_36815 [Sorangium sp. So ce327]|uniref:hypothetical protein n=1 Tax=Sorangium sp. So ce327 TaxID=3133301 RepID=UPI003F6110EF